MNIPCPVCQGQPVVNMTTEGLKFYICEGCGLMKTSPRLASHPLHSWMRLETEQNKMALVVPFLQELRNRKEISGRFNVAPIDWITADGDLTWTVLISTDRGVNVYTRVMLGVNQLCTDVSSGTDVSYYGHIISTAPDIKGLVQNVVLKHLKAVIL